MWDLKQMLAAFEATLRAGAKDEAAWGRMRGQIYAEPAEVRRERLTGTATAAAPARVGMSAGSVAALLASAMADDAKYGTA